MTGRLSPEPTSAPREHGWRAVVASAIGAHHVNAGLAYEDACAVRPTSGHRRPTPVLAVAVADGHGHARHFRSARGAEIAVRIATQVATDAAAEDATPDALRQSLRTHIGPDLVSGWRRAVAADLAGDPPSAIELSAAGLTAAATDEQKIYGYGATVILALATEDWLLCAQIGDGDAFAVTASGRALRLVPDDPRLDGWRTTSLCQPDALDSMRFGAIKVRGSDIVAVVLATDGFGNAQVRDDWDTTFATDLVGLIADRGFDWIAESLPKWVAACASSDGSGDDVTVALMFTGGGAR